MLQHRTCSIPLLLDTLYVYLYATYLTNASLGTLDSLEWETTTPA